MKAEEIIATVLHHLTNGPYNGVGGTCYECPFASDPLDRRGNLAAWEEISNDPTEAYFRCSLPGRDNEKVEWGEYAPCIEVEWARAALNALPSSATAAPQGAAPGAEA